MAILDWSRGELESAMLHACNAVDGTARKRYSKMSNALRFTRLLRECYSILGPMGAPGINLDETRFPVSVRRATTSDGKPDMADVVYGIHRCTHGHGDDLPEGFALLEDAGGTKRFTRMEIERGKIRLSDRIIFGLLAVAILSPQNRGQTVPDGYILTYSDSVVMNINEWWGRASDFPAIVASDPPIKVKLDFGDWM